jgi:hypothetical protein
MSQETEQTELFLSWQGNISGPHSKKDIQQLLKVGKIHSLYKIQVRGEWILLRDYLADLEQKARDAARRKAAMPPTTKPTYASGSVPHAILVPEDDFSGSAISAMLIEAEPISADKGAEESKGLAITCFVLSCLFFIPFLNLLTWLMGLIFGHLALSQIGVGSKSKAATLNSVGLWLSYVELGFFLIGLAYFKVIDVRDMEVAFFVLHGHMLGIALAALLGAGLLMLAVKLSAGKLIGFSTCFVGALLPAAVNTLATLILQSSLAPSELSSGIGIAMFGFISLILFVGQMFFWANYIRLPDGRELGYVNAALSSLLYTVIFIFISIGYLVLIAVVSS